jgi:hypothetical protein
MTRFAYIETEIALRRSSVALGLKGQMQSLQVLPLVPSFHTVDRQTYRRVVIAGLLLCAAFVAISFFLRPQAEARGALVKADRLIRDRRRGEIRPLCVEIRLWRRFPPPFSGV